MGAKEIMAERDRIERLETLLEEVDSFVTGDLDAAISGLRDIQRWAERTGIAIGADLEAARRSLEVAMSVAERFQSDVRRKLRSAPEPEPELAPDEIDGSRWIS